MRSHVGESICAPRPARDDDFERTSTPSTSSLNMGPSHPATHGTVKFLIELDGETIVDLDIQVGYLHRGFEKECESGTWYQAIPYTDRLNYNSAILANLGYCMAVEKLLGLETAASAASGCACWRASSRASAIT